MEQFCDRRWRIPLFVILFIMTVFCSASLLSIFVKADNLNPGVYSTDSKPFGIPYGEWLAEWNKWFIQFDKDMHPRDHYTSEMCSKNQTGPVWFLTDVLKKETEPRTCTMPSGKAILLPLLSGSAWDDKTDPAQATSDGLRKSAESGNNDGIDKIREINATVDGREIVSLKGYRAQSPFFNITVPEDNVFHQKPGVWKAVIDGYFLFLEPLSPGTHTIQTTTTVWSAYDPHNYVGVVTYRIIVQP